MITINFEKSNAEGTMTYRDALYLDDDHTYTDEEIEAMKQARFDNWIAIVTTRSQEVPVVDAPVIAE